MKQNIWLAVLVLFLILAAVGIFFTGGQESPEQLAEITYPGTGEEFFAIHPVYYGGEMTITCADGVLEN